MNEQRLQGQTIFLSASVPSRPHWSESHSKQMGARIRNAVLAFTERVFYEGGSLVFGGHPSISPFILSVAERYLTGTPKVGRGKIPSIQIYQSKAFPPAVRPEATSKLVALGGKLREIEPEPGEKFQPNLVGKEQCLASLKTMRKKMLTESKPLGMVVIGGMEGILRECLAFREYCPGRPIWVIETTGGMAGQLLEPDLPYAKDFFHMLRVEPKSLGVVPAERALLQDIGTVSEPPYVLLAERMLGTLAQAR